MSTQTVVWTVPKTPFATIEVLESKRNLWTELTSTTTTTTTTQNVKKDQNSVVDNEDRSNNVRTHSKLCVLMPGNPGLVEFYEPFAVEMDRRGVDVLVMGYAGHSFTDFNNGRVFGLQEQIEVANEFIATLLASNKVQHIYRKHLYLAGHSIGGYVAMHMLARFPAFTKFFGLCAVLSNIASSPKGKRLSLWTKPHGQWLASAFASLYPVFPHSWKMKVIEAVYHDAEPVMQQKMLMHLSTANVMNVINMFADEYRQVGAPDQVLLTSLQEKMYLYYVPCDEWAPPANAREIKTICPRLSAFIIETDEKVAHAWCLHHTNVVIDNAMMPFM